MADDLEAQIGRWRRYLERHRALAPADVDELEAHLRDQIDELEQSGLSPDEGFLVAVGRLGRIDDISREFAREHSGRLWKQLVLEGSESASRGRGLGVALTMAVIAAVLVKLPDLWGAPPDAVVRFGALLLLSPLAVYFLIRRRCRVATIATVGGIFALAAVVLGFSPFVTGGQTMPLAAIHAVVLLWLTAGIAYAAGDWRSERARMDLIRFTGEWVVYYALIALGGGVLAALTLAVFGSIDIDAGRAVGQWMMPCGAAGAVIVAAWLVEAKQSVVENIAPVLTKIFTPLFTALLLVLVVAAIVQRDLVGSNRDLLILFDAVLVIVLGLLLYALSAREPASAPSWFDRLQLVMLLSAIVVDLIVLIAVGARIGTYGFSANRVVALGLNLVLLVNLVFSAVLQWRFSRGRSGLARLVRWQTDYLPVFFLWSAFVVFVLPALFGFV